MGGAPGETGANAMIPCPAQIDVDAARAATHCVVMAATFWSMRRDLREAPTALRSRLASILGAEPVSWTTAVGLRCC